MAVKLVFLQALSSLHAGTGQGVGTIDLPVARERATNLPIVPGSSIKGVLRAAVRKDFADDDDWLRIFGKQDRAGRLQVSDGRLLLLPVRCLGATFVWTTSPYVLRRFLRDGEAAAVRGVPAEVPAPPKDAAGLSSRDPLLDYGSGARLVLEDLDFAVDEKSEALTKKWGQWLANNLFPAEADWREEFQRRFAVVDDQSFAFLAEHATEVNAHIEIGKDGVVKSGALWYEETLPAETVLASIMRGELDDIGDKDTDAWKILLSGQGPHRFVQLGGNATTGQGLVRVVAAGGAA